VSQEPPAAAGPTDPAAPAGSAGSAAAKAPRPKAGAIPRQAMPERPPAERIKTFDEVPYGYTPELARKEAERCLFCKKPKCVAGCPVNIDIPGFIQLVRAGDFLAAARKVKEQNTLPAICGRVCPQEEQCEILCVLGQKFQPVAIGRLERFVADYEREQNAVTIPAPAAPTGRRVAVVGSGPAGLTAAGELVRLGHAVTVFEALHQPGGVLVYGIPEFRLPKAIVAAEVEYLRRLGVQVELDFVVGRTATLEELLAEYDAIFLGTGAGLPLFLGVPGENLIGVYSANEYLTRSNLMKAYRFPEYDTPLLKPRRAVVVGGGNVALDSARTARRFGAQVTLVYRRSRKELPARHEEVEHAEQEGVELKLLTNPTRVLGDERGRVTEIECLRMELGEPDASGRRRPVPVAGSEFRIPCDTLVVAIGNSPNPLIPKTTPALKATRHGTLEADEESGQTTLERVYAGGDVVTGAATVIRAMGAGKRAALEIDALLKRAGPLRGQPLTPMTPRKAEAAGAAAAG